MGAAAGRRGACCSHTPSLQSSIFAFATGSTAQKFMTRSGAPFKMANTWCAIAPTPRRLNNNHNNASGASYLCASRLVKATCPDTCLVLFCMCSAPARSSNSSLLCLVASCAPLACIFAVKSHLIPTLTPRSWIFFPRAMYEPVGEQETSAMCVQIIHGQLGRCKIRKQPPKHGEAGDQADPPKRSNLQGNPHIAKKLVSACAAEIGPKSGNM